MRLHSKYEDPEDALNFLVRVVCDDAKQNVELVDDQIKSRLLNLMVKASGRQKPMQAESTSSQFSDEFAAEFSQSARHQRQQHASMVDAHARDELDRWMADRSSSLRRVGAARETTLQFWQRMQTSAEDR